MKLTDRELEMADQLVDEMTTHWDPSNFHDSFSEEVMKLVEQKVHAGQTETVTQPESQEATTPKSNVVDLTELLQRSLRGGSKSGKSRKNGEKIVEKGAEREMHGAKPPKEDDAHRVPLRASAASQEDKATTKAKASSRRKSA